MKSKVLFALIALSLFSQGQASDKENLEENILEDLIRGAKSGLVDSLEKLNEIGDLESLQQDDMELYVQFKKYINLTSKESQQRAITAWENHQNPPKLKNKKRKFRNRKKATIVDYLGQSVRGGYVPALIECLQKEKEELEESYSRDCAEMKDLEIRLGQGQSKISLLEIGKKLSNVHDHSSLFDHLHDLNQEIERLQDLEKDGTSFYYDDSFLKSNKLSHLHYEDSFTDFSDLRKKSKQKKKQPIPIERLQTRHQSLMKSVENQKSSLLKMRKKITVLKNTPFYRHHSSFVLRVEKEYEDYVQKISVDLEKISNFLSSVSDKFPFEETTSSKRREKLSKFFESVDNCFHKIDKISSSFSSSVLAVIEEYSKKENAISPSDFQVISKIKQELVTMMCSLLYKHDDYYDDDEWILFAIYKHNVSEYEEIQFHSDSVREQILLLREAEKYLEALDNSEKYFQITNPSFYQALRKKQKTQKLWKYRSHHWQDNFEFQGVVGDLVNFVKRSLVNLHLVYVNGNFQTYKRKFTENESQTFFELRNFIRFSKWVEKSLKGRKSLSSINTYLSDTGFFYKNSGRTQTIFTCKNEPFFIRVDSEKNEYKVGYLSNHPYTKKGLLVLNRRNGPLLFDRENELFKSTSRNSFIIPSSHKDILQWTEKGLSKKDALMKAAHPKI